MPCYSDYNERNKPNYNSSDNIDGTILYRLRDENKKLEASLCAIITELENRGIAHDVITQASKSGLVDIIEFWNKHSKEDEARIAKELHKFSEHEQEVIKKLLNDKK